MASYRKMKNHTSINFQGKKVLKNKRTGAQRFQKNRSENYGKLTKKTLSKNVYLQTNLYT